jgi:hypothetical protein
MHPVELGRKKLGAFRTCKTTPRAHEIPKNSEHSDLVSPMTLAELVQYNLSRGGIRRVP